MELGAHPIMEAGLPMMFGVLPDIAKYQRSLYGKTSIISGLINKNRRNIVPCSHYIPTSFYLYLQITLPIK